ncbi:MAG TPA: hypothetical protein H9775_04370 [Candidatus Blautia merdipullorum]|nr:hypothetical protein [Candidatus Blautia merdipullorum]
MTMKHYIREIREHTAGMDWRERAEYILTYYWYHILGMAAAVCLILFLIIHFGFREEPPLFTCALVNQEINFTRDEEIEKDFSADSGIDEGRMEINSDFNIAYGNLELEGINESSYEKFFFKWQNGELDAVVLPESFYKYCRDLGGVFRNLKNWNTEGFTLYEEKGAITAVDVENTILSGYLENKTGETLLLAFPDTGQHEEECRAFLDFIRK